MERIEYLDGEFRRGFNLRTVQSWLWEPAGSKDTGYGGKLYKSKLRIYFENDKEIVLQGSEADRVYRQYFDTGLFKSPSA